MANDIQGLLGLTAGIPSEEEDRLQRQSQALLAASDFAPSDPLSAIAKGIAQGVGLTKGVQAGKAKSQRLQKIQEIAQQHLALKEHTQQLEQLAQQAKAQEDALRRVGPTVAGAYLQFTQNGNINMLRGNLSSVADDLLRQQGTGLANMSFADGNPTQVIIEGKDGSVANMSIFQVANAIRKDNPQLADSLLASLGGFNPELAEAQRVAEAGAKFGVGPEEAGQIALGLSQPVQRTQEVPPQQGQIPTNPQGHPSIAQIQDEGLKKIAVEQAQAQLNEARAQAENANELISQTQRFKSALGNFKTDLAGEARLAVGKFLNTIKEGAGDAVINGEVAAGEVIKSLSIDFMLSYVQRTKGAISEREGDWFLDASGGLTKSTEGNMRLVNAMEAGAMRKLERSRFLESWFNTHGTTAGAEEQWQQYMENNPVITSDGTIIPENVSNWQPWVTSTPSEASEAASRATQPTPTSGGIDIDAIDAILKARGAL